MPKRKGPQSRWAEQGDASDQKGLPALRERWLEALRVANLSKRTIWSRRIRLHPFLWWCHQRGLVYPQDVTRPILERYQTWVAHYRKDDATPWDVQTQIGHIGVVRYFFSWLAKKDIILFNPASELESPKRGRRLPKDVLNISEVERIMAQPDVATPLGIRDRAILEVFYSTGIRRMELAGLKLRNVDFTKGIIYVRRGKGDKDRVVPIGERAIAWVNKYLTDVRPTFLKNPLEDALFLTHHGGALSETSLTKIAFTHVHAARLGKQGSCHLFRHSMATTMLDNGADIRFIQEILGHAFLTSTEIYTHVSIGKLKAVHAATHPTAKLAAQPVEPEADLNAAREALLDALDDEAAQEQD